MKRSLALNDHAIRNCSKAIELNPTYLKALLRRAEIYEETDKLGDKAPLEDFGITGGVYFRRGSG